MLRHFFKSIWMALRAFSLGIGIGALTARHSGAESRRLIKTRLLSLVDSAEHEPASLPASPAVEAHASSSTSSKAVGGTPAIEL